MAQEGQLHDKSVDAMCRWASATMLPPLGPKRQPYIYRPRPSTLCTPHRGVLAQHHLLMKSPSCRALFNGNFCKVVELHMLRSVSTEDFKVR